MEVKLVSSASLFFIQIAEGDIQAHGAVAQGRRVKLSWRNFQARIEFHRPLDNVSFPAGFGDRFLRAGEYPLLVRVPRSLAPARLSFQQSAHAYPALAGLGKVANHLP